MAKREVIYTVRLDKSLKVILTIAAVGLLLIGARPLFQSTPAQAEISTLEMLQITNAIQQGFSEIASEHSSGMNEVARAVSDIECGN